MCVDPSTAGSPADVTVSGEGKFPSVNKKRDT